MARFLALEDIVDARTHYGARPRRLSRPGDRSGKRLRRIEIGPFASVVFENKTTIRFQIQEMARAERMFTDEAIQGELDTYNTLLPRPGRFLHDYLFLELRSDEELREWLPKLVGIERAVIVRLADGADELIERAEVDAAHAEQLTREEMTASVHYVRIRLSPRARELFGSARVAIGIDHPGLSLRNRALRGDKSRFAGRLGRSVARELVLGLYSSTSSRAK